MSVRGTTHARHHKKIIVHDGNSPRTGEKIFCAWEDCDNDGFELYKVRVNYGRDEFGRPYNSWYVFCCEDHKQYFVNSHRDHTNLPNGYKASRFL